MSVDVIPVPTDEAVREGESRLLGVERNVVDFLRKQQNNNNFSGTIPYIVLTCRKRKDLNMIANKVYTRDEMREEHIITTDYRFIDKEGEYFAKLIMRAEASKNMMRLFFQLSDGRKIITPVFWWQSYLGFYEIDNGTNLRLIYERNGKGISLKEIEILD